MRQHIHYYEFEAPNLRNLGEARGEVFGEQLREAADSARQKAGWSRRRERGRPYLEFTRQYFPDYAAELEGFAGAACIELLDLWTLGLEDELEGGEHCTTLLDRGERQLAHNEDWSPESADLISVIKRSVGHLTVLELNYCNTLGGNSISINSHGLVQAVNSLSQPTRPLGVPANIICRWFSDQTDPAQILESFSRLPLGMGYAFLWLRPTGRPLRLEYGGGAWAAADVTGPYVHTNHFLEPRMAAQNPCPLPPSSKQRLERAELLLHSNSPALELIELAADKNGGAERGLLNRRTIARVLLDLDQGVFRVLLLRERELGWVDYPLDFIETDV